MSVPIVILAPFDGTNDEVIEKERAIVCACFVLHLKTVQQSGRVNSSMLCMYRSSDIIGCVSIGLKMP